MYRNASSTTNGATVETISSVLESDHKHLDDLLERTRAGDADAAVALKAGLQRHIAIEEEVLFPAFLAAGGPSGPIQVMQLDHARFLDLLKRLGEPGVAPRLVAELGAHNDKEEHVLYPLCDRLLDSERAVILDRIHRALADGR